MSEISSEAPPDFSVVIPAWNAEDHLEASVNSALSQSSVGVEVIIVDDASHDGTAALAERLAAADPRVIALRSPRNQGPAAARNQAIAAARGAWIAILDADDRFASGRLSALLAFARHRGADAAFDLFEEVGEDGNALADSSAPRVERPEKWNLADWADRNVLGRAGAAMPVGYLKPIVRRAFIVDRNLAYRDKLRNSEDYLFMAEILAAGGEVWVLPETGYLYTRRAGSVSHRIGPAHLQALLAAERSFINAQRETLEAPALRALVDRMNSVADALACEQVVFALKARDPITPLHTLAARPRAIRLVILWLMEVIAKRLP